METTHIEEVLLKYGQETVHRMAQKLSHTDNLKNNLKPIVYDDQGGPALGIEMPHYAQFVNDGRRAGSKQPPIEVIKNWAKEKGIPQFKDDKGKYISESSRAFLIARKIGRDGIKPIPFFKIFFDHISDLNEQLGIGAATDYADSFQILLNEAGVGNI